MLHPLTERLSAVLGLGGSVELTRAAIIALISEGLPPGIETVGDWREALIAPSPVEGLPHNAWMRTILINYFDQLPGKMKLADLRRGLELESQPPRLSEQFEQDARTSFWPHQKLRFWRAAYRARQREAVGVR